jgi:hypothetical protein
MRRSNSAILIWDATSHYVTTGTPGRRRHLLGFGGQRNARTAVAGTIGRPDFLLKRATLTEPAGESLRPERLIAAVLAERLVALPEILAAGGRRLREHDLQAQELADVVGLVAVGAPRA